jgi:ankyrin repeat protein
MIAKLLFFLFSFVLAGSILPPKILAKLNEKIVAGDVNALQLIIDSNPKFIKNLYAKPYRNGAFIMAVQEGHIPVIELLLEKGNVNPAANENAALRIASGMGNVPLVRILLDRPEVTLDDMGKKALIEATSNGHTEVVRLMLDHPKFNPSVGVDQAAFLASSMNHADIVKLFIIDGRLNPSILHTFTLNHAAQFGNVDLVRFLLGYPYFRQVAREVVIKADFKSIKTLADAGFAFDPNTLDISLWRARSRGNYALSRYLESLKEKLKISVGSSFSMTEQCAICLADDNLLGGIMTSCNHQFHAECLQQWIAKHKSCPMCRSSII